jgi:hypothetical protein
MTQLHGVVVIAPAADAGEATVVVRLLDVSRMDVPSIELARTTLENVAVAPGAAIPFTLEVADLGNRSTSVQAHVDYVGDGARHSGDLLTTQSISASVLGRSAKSAGEVPTTKI